MNLKMSVCFVCNILIAEDLTLNGKSTYFLSVVKSSKIITAQKLRGVWITDVTFKEKLKFIFNLDSFIVPLFVRVFHYAEQLSITALYRQNIGDVLTLNKINMKDISFLFIFAAAIWGIYAGTIIL